jgi:putative phosphotransacetylase
MKKVIAEISARHLHLSESDLAKLFGKDYKLKKYKDLSQPGEFAARETVEVIGPKGKFAKVRIIGPSRSKTQVELAASDCRQIGINAVWRISGDHKKTPGAKIKGPKGSIVIKKGVIVPLRHLHISNEQAKLWKLKNKKTVSAKVGGSKALVFKNIVVRVGDYHTSIHLDTDDANAAGLLSCSKIDLDI